MAAPTIQKAVDLLRGRLTSRLARVRGHRDPHRLRGTAGPAGRDDEPTREHRPHRRGLPPEERSIVRHRSYSLPCRTAAAAVCEKEAMDYDFHLFTDAATGRGSVLCHRYDGQYGSSHPRGSGTGRARRGA
ncbi:sigma 54 modulation/S30EA ribosomal C-terminal domain-containing protein [Kitasatospora purpeofusca]|uniref:sigma 54 modulation/S30EA ribosomal C-terminal domain-containing protein n=1 Tax=Kitasatospora purpeofusca TaxID=67352 RepID=UPI002E0E2E43|nr:sigma 54 modulation/S30EA ribosomal C-terminal domain-containing protein [Kitasatospora purpeofusca]WSR37931.1 sigma 54 modulation/S30EA ribosomal C-terminal domain-containing protein [Kitasatospora purpeofusca]